MSEQKFTLTQEQLSYIVEQTQIGNPKEAIEYFVGLMIKEEIRPRYMQQVVEKLMERERYKK